MEACASFKLRRVVPIQTQKEALLSFHCQEDLFEALLRNLANSFTVSVSPEQSETTDKSVCVLRLHKDVSLKML